MGLFCMTRLFVETVVVLLLDTFLFSLFQFLNQLPIVPQDRINSLRLVCVGHASHAAQVLHLITRLVRPHQLLFGLFLRGSSPMACVFPIELFNRPYIPSSFKSVVMMICLLLLLDVHQRGKVVLQILKGRDYIHKIPECHVRFLWWCPPPSCFQVL